MLSRIADSLFWLNRYMERADGLLRVSATHYILSLDKDINGHLSWKPLLQTFTNLEEADAAALENDSLRSLKKLLLDASNNNSLKVIINRARENARGVQDHITKEVWEEVNEMYHLLSDTTLNKKFDVQDVMVYMEQFMKHCTMYTGIADTTMPRGIGWGFMCLGKYVERCLQTIVVADKQFAQKEYNMDAHTDIMDWRYLLLALSGYELHLKTYRSTVNHNNNVLHQVLFNSYFPHSVVYSLTRIDKYLQDVLNENQSIEKYALKRCFGRLYSKVRYTDLNSLDSDTLQAFFKEIKTDLLQFSSMLGQCFFSYS